MPSIMPSNLATRDIESLVHPYTNLVTFRETGPLIIERGQGIHVYDTAGRGYIDGMAGLWCTALGWGNDELAETAAAQMRKLAFGHLFGGKSHDGAIELAEKLKEIAPVPTSKVFFCNSGSEANDTQIKLVWYMNNALGRPRKKKIVSRPTRPISTSRSPTSSTPRARTTTVSRMRARASRILRRGLPPSSTS